jgi:pyruvate formate lyase activating enzyme
MMDPQKHKKFTGVTNRLILDNLRRLVGKGSELIVRIPLIPGVNDDFDNLDRSGSFLNQLAPGIQVEILPYHDFQKNKYNRFGIHYDGGKTTPPGKQELSRIRERLQGFGLNVTIGG